MIAKNVVISKVLGAADKMKHEKNTDDNCDSITIIHDNTVAGSKAPRNFMGKRKKLDHNKFATLIHISMPYRFSDHHDSKCIFDG